MQLAGARERIYALTMTTSRIISAGSACAPRLWEHPLQTSPQELPTAMVPLARSRSRTGAMIPPLNPNPSPPPLTSMPPLPSAPGMRVSASSPAIPAAAKAGLATANAKSWPEGEDGGATRAAAAPAAELVAEGGGGGGKPQSPLPPPSKPKRFGILRMLLKVRPAKKASDRPVVVARPVANRA
jgi:hypothetical protein